MKKIQEILNKLLYIIPIVILALMILIGNVKNGILLSVVAIVFIYFFVKKIKIKHFALFLIVFSMITKLACILILKTPILADYWIMYEASQNMLAGSYDFTNKLYFLAWGYQLFNVLYEFVVFSIYNNIIMLKILNCVYSTVITVLIYKIVKKLTSENTARITSLIYCISIYPLYLNSVLGNQQLGLMLAMIAIYLFLYKENKNIILMLIGVILGLSNLERPEGIIFVLTMVTYLFFDKTNIKTFIKKSSIIVISYLIVVNGASLLLIKSGFNEIGFKNENPYWKFVVGLSYDHDGKYNTDDEYFSLVANKEEAKKETFNRLKQVNKMPKLFYNKIKILWLYDDLEDSFNVKNINIPSNITETIINHMKIINIIILSLASYGLINNKDKQTKFFTINIILYFIVYLFTEVMLRYYYTPQVAIIILSSLGIEKLLKSKYLTSK